jgi:hypothetical protein
MEKNNNNDLIDRPESLSVEYTYRIYRLLIFVVLLLVLVRFIHNDLSDFDQLKYVLTSSSVFMFMEIYYPSVTIDN